MVSSPTCDTIIQMMDTHLPVEQEQMTSYLLDHITIYADHPCFQKILSHIARLCVTRLSPAQGVEFIASTAHEHEICGEILGIVRDLIEERDFTGADRVIRYILPYAKGEVESENAEKFLAFRDFIEYAYVMTYMPEKRELPVHPYLGTAILFQYGVILKGRGKYDAAFRIYHLVREHSPASAQVLLEIADIYREKNNLEAFREITISGFACAWKTEELARTYRNMGYYFGERGDYDAAVTCYLMGSTWEDSPETGRELQYLAARMGHQPDITFYLEKGREILASREIPFGPNEEMIDLLVQYAEVCEEEGDLFEARRYLTRAKLLKISDDLERKIERIERFMEDATSF